MCHFYWTNPAGTTTVRSCAGWDFKNIFITNISTFSPQLQSPAFSLWPRRNSPKSGVCLRKIPSDWRILKLLLTDWRDCVMEKTLSRLNCLGTSSESPRVNGFEINRGRTGVSVSRNLGQNLTKNLAKQFMTGGSSHLLLSCLSPPSPP